MLLASIIAIILFGILLLVLEILVLPGLIAGIVGTILMILGIVMMYTNFGEVSGNITLICTFFLTASLLFYVLKTKAWRRFGLKDTIDSKVIDLPAANIELGTIALTISALRPMGTVLIGTNKYEAQTNGSYIEANNPVIVIRVLTNKLLVELKSQE